MIRALCYLRDCGMIERGWVSWHKARKLVSLRAAIQGVDMRNEERDFFMLGLISATVNRIANIKFGPEVYCLSKPKRSKVDASFAKQTRMMIDDVGSLRESKKSTTRAGVFLGDSRQAEIFHTAAPKGADFIITSPPYPNEHDYTRCTRLELILLGHVLSLDDLRRLKKQMVRCNTKGLYVTDSESRLVARYRGVQEVAQRLDRRARDNVDGFSVLYGRMVREYFGGMVSHFRSATKSLRSGGLCAYVLSDQQSLLGVHLDTPAILSALASSRAQGFQIQEVIEWKRTRGSTGKRILSERIIVLRKN